jgi:hypothetical protein
MLGDVLDLVKLTVAAPWIAATVVSLVTCAWLYRQYRRGLTDLDARLSLSAARQGERLGKLEKVSELLALRRRQVEAELIDLGVDLPYWPPDGPTQPRARLRPRADEDLADEPTAAEFARSRVPVPPLPADIGARHRRTSDA